MASNSDWNPGTGLKDFTGTFRNNVFGTSDQGQYAQNAAEETQAEAKRQQQLATDQGKAGLSQLQDLSKATPQELQAYGQSLSAASDQLAQSQKIMDSIDPAIMEASKQVLSVLQGKQTGVGNAIGAQRAQQRTQLVNQLRAQYGPGAETSSLGQQALQKFDLETNTQTATMQNQTLGTLMGTINSRPSLTGALTDLNAAGANFGGIQNRQIGAYAQGNNSLLNAMVGTASPVISAAGADQVKNLTESGAQRQFWDNWSNSSMAFGEQFGGMGMGKIGGGGGGGNGIATGSNPASGWQPMSAPGNSYWANNPYS